MADHRGYADETHTGGRAPLLRGLGAVTIAAHCSSDDGFEWLDKFKRDYLPEKSELKSAVVLAKIAINDDARDFLLKRIEPSSIVIIDFAEHTKDLIGNILMAVDSERDAVNSATAFLKSGHLPREVAEQVLRFARTRILSHSAVGHVEDLLKQAASVSGVPLGSGDQLFDKEILFKLSEAEFKELIARFSIALGEALRPERRADRIVEILVDRGMHHDGHIAMACLEAATESRTVFDRGYSMPFEMLMQADQKIQQAIEHWSCRDARTDPGRLAQEDSRLLLGLQAADITAGYAALLFEEAQADTPIAARAVRAVFPNVMLNEHWLR